jgi:hypothetical protein
LPLFLIPIFGAIAAVGTQRFTVDDIAIDVLEVDGQRLAVAVDVNFAEELQPSVGRTVGFPKRPKRSRRKWTLVVRMPEHWMSI